jgi:hypothetical protein
MGRRPDRASNKPDIHHPLFLFFNDSMEEILAPWMKLHRMIETGWPPAEPFLPYVESLEIISLEQIRNLSKVFHNVSSSLKKKDSEALSKKLLKSQKRVEQQVRFFADGFSRAVRSGRYWNNLFIQNPASFSADMFLSLPNIELVWRIYQTHQLDGIPVPVAVTKLHVSVPIFLEINIIIINFPSLPGGWNPPVKVLIPSATKQKNGRTITAFDTIGTHVGNPIYPQTGEFPGSNFSGYMKSIYTTGVPAGCSIKYRTVLYPTTGYLPQGMRRWTMMPPQPQPDPPGGNPTVDLGGGRWVCCDFPNSWAGNLPPSSHIYRNDKFRTWVLESCPGVPDKLLGYYEWGFTMLLHVIPGSKLEEVRIPPAPPNIPPPPGGWPPNAPSTRPVTWTDSENADEQARRDYQTLFPN